MFTKYNNLLPSNKLESTMKISFLSLIVGILLAIIIICGLYYGIYQVFNTYQKIRHPFKSPSPLPTPKDYTTTSISEWSNETNSCIDEYIVSGVVFIQLNGMCLSVDETLTKLVTVKFNSTDSSQKWLLTFYRNPNDPLEDKRGIIYNIKHNRYISFENGNLILKELTDPVNLMCPEVIEEKCLIKINSITNLSGDVYISLEDGTITTTKNKEKSAHFSIISL